MSKEQIDSLIDFFILQLPVASFVLIALWRKWIYLGGTVQALLTAKDKMIELLDKLRTEAVNDKHLVEERASAQDTRIEELTDVVRQSLEFNSRIIEGVAVRGARNSARASSRTRSDRSSTKRTRQETRKSQ